MKKLIYSNAFILLFSFSIQASADTPTETIHESENSVFVGVSNRPTAAIKCLDGGTGIEIQVPEGTYLTVSQQRLLVGTNLRVSYKILLNDAVEAEGCSGYRIWSRHFNAVPR